MKRINTDGNLAALDAYLKEADAEEYEQEWKDNWLTEKSAEVMEVIEKDGVYPTGYFRKKLNGERVEVMYTYYDFITELDNDSFNEDVNNIFVSLMKGDTPDCTDVIIYAIESYFKSDADNAYESAHEDNRY